MDLPTVLFYQPIYNLLITFYRFLGTDLTLAIIAVALTLRIILYPLTRRQMLAQARLSEVSKEMNVKVEEAKKHYKDNKELQDKEVLKIQQEYLPQQLGCFGMLVPLLLQSFFFISMYNALIALFKDGVTSFNTVAYPFVAQFGPGEALNARFLQVIDMGAFPAHQTEPQWLFIYTLFPLSAAISQTVSFWLTTRFAKNTAAAKKAAGEKDSKSKKEESSDDKPNPDQFGDIALRLNNQMSVFFAILIFMFGLNSPVGLSVYWTVQSVFVIIQQLVIKQHNNYNDRRQARIAAN